MSELRDKTVTGLFWSAVERIIQIAAQFITTIILARMLSPSDFGLIGMLALFMAISQSIIDSGFGSALIQKQDVSQIDYSTVFYINLLFGFALFLGLYFSAPLLSKFFNQPVLVTMTRVLALSPLINSLGIVQHTILTKKLQFKVIAKISIIAVVVSSVISIFLAFTGFGVWSLVFQILSVNFTRTILFWIFNRWKPYFCFSYNSLKSLFSYGSKLFLAGMIDQFFKNIYKFIIGKQYDSVNLGYYIQAKRMQEIPVLNILSIMQRVTFPVYSTIQNDILRLKYVYRKTIKATVYLNFPIMIMLIILAPQFVPILLTTKWVPSIVYLQLLCISGLFYPLSALNLNILKVKGRTDIFLYLELVNKVFTIVAIILTIKLGVIYLVIGYVIVNFIYFSTNIVFSGKIIDYSVREQIQDIFPYLAVALTMGLAMFLLTVLLASINPVLRLLIVFFFGITIYYFMSKSLKNEIYRDIISVIINHSKLL